MLLLNILIPGAGLILRGRLWSGSIALLAAMVCLGLLILSPIIATAEFAQSLLLQFGLIYLCLSLLSSLWLWYCTRKPSWDQAELRQLHDQASKAYLLSNYDQAIEVAQRICQQASNLIGSWQLLAIIADAKGDHQLARKARDRVQILLEEDV